jgi:hypothetical protein
MAWQDVAAKIVQGAAGAAGNTNAQAEVGAWQQRKQGLEDEQRQLKQSELDKQAASGAISPVQWGSATSDLYAHEPAESRLGRLKRGAERIVGMKKQADAQKAQADTKLAAQPSPKADYASIQASAKTPDQLAAEKQKQAISTFTQEGDIKNTQKSAAETKAREDTLALIDKYITDPEENKAAKQEYTQKQAGIFGSPKFLPGQPFEYPVGSGQYAKNATNSDGTISIVPIPGYHPSAPKPSTSPAGIYTNLLAKKILADGKQGPPLTPQESAQLEAAKGALTVAGIARAEAWAQAAARNHLQAVTNDAGEDVLVPVSQGIAAANAGQPMTAGVVGSPTGADKKNQMLAQSAITQVDRMLNILRQDPNLTGPGAGQLTTLQTWLGTQDPEAQAFIVSSLLGSEHGVAVFGGRNIHTISDLQSAIGSMKTNPKALAAALQVIKETMQPWQTANGRLPAPRAAQGSGAKYKVGDPIMQDGHKFKATAVDQNGKVTAADPVQ